MPQFSLLALMKGIAAAAVVAALATLPAQTAAPMILVITLLITPHILLRVHRGERLERAFCVGLLVPLSGLIVLGSGYVHAVVLFDHRDSYLEAMQEAFRRMPLFRAHALASWGFGLLSGAACWWVVWQEGRRSERRDERAAAAKTSPPPRPPRAISRIIFEFAGGPLDGKTVVGDLGDSGEADRYYHQTAQGCVGEAFGVAWDFTTDAPEATPPSPPAPQRRHRYQVTDRLEGDGEVLLRAEYRTAPRESP